MMPLKDTAPFTEKAPVEVLTPYFCKDVAILISEYSEITIDSAFFSQVFYFFCHDEKTNYISPTVVDVFFKEDSLRRLRANPRNPLDNNVWKRLDFFERRGYRLNNSQDFENILSFHPLTRGISRLIIEDDGVCNERMVVDCREGIYISHIFSALASLSRNVVGKVQHYFQHNIDIEKVSPVNILYDPQRDALVLKVKISCIRVNTER